jgi:hypothetical protein
MSDQITHKIESIEGLANLSQWMIHNVTKGLAGGPVMVTLGRESRSIPQNSLLWAILSEVSAQVDWYGQRLSAEDWKHVFSAALQRQRVVPGIDGGFVMCGMSTSKMDKKTFSDLLEIIFAFGAQHGVKWSDPNLATFEQYREAKNV